MRGKLIASEIVYKPLGNIPAYAGKTQSGLSGCCRMSEHPRVCGENLEGKTITESLAGTSPRMRGKLTGSCERKHRGGNIPAYAGKTILSRTKLKGGREHPRVCGENAKTKIFPVTLAGTSPRMRGKLISAHGCHGKIRNIPAYAGKTMPYEPLIPAPEEHPRVCGENVAGLQQALNGKGTSPRMRGKLRWGLG